jgi:prophage regulatory protein
MLHPTQELEPPANPARFKTMKRLVAEKHLRRPAVEAITGLSRSTIYDLMAKGLFPRPVRLTQKTVGWPESKIAGWLASRSVSTGEAA